MFNFLQVFFAIFIIINPHESIGKPAASTIFDMKECVILRPLCPNLVDNDDILILECLQSVNPAALVNINQQCQNTIWNHTKALIQNKRVYDVIKTNCKPQNDGWIANCVYNETGHDYLKCLLRNRNEIGQEECTNIIQRLESVAFQDYQWILDFLKDCTSDIEKFECGRYDPYNMGQTNTIACLQEKVLKIDPICRKSVFKLSEIQADNIKLDRQLYMACAEDHNRYCQQFPAGSGRVFACLNEQPFDKLKVSCQKQLLRRQKMIAQDYRISKGLMRACRDDIKKMHCRKQTANDKTTRLAQILLCLENVMKNGTKVDPDCEVEMVDHRRMLMEDFRLSPEIVDGCREEIQKHCYGLEAGGKTIHCLMDHARLKNLNNPIKDMCKRALESLIKESDAGEDWRVDPVLHQACYPIARTVCRDVKGGDARMLSCLMDNIGADHMTDECKDALIQIQYFVARDFKLDPQLYRACREDARNFCHAGRNWDENEEPSNSPQVLPCLYRYAYQEDQRFQLRNGCLQQIKRVMRQRAISVDLQPEIEEVCLDDLGRYCVGQTKKGEETLCLQKNLETLSTKCKEAVQSFTEIEAEHAEFNPYIMAHCRKEMEHFCAAELKHDEGDVTECLISHKNDPAMRANQACRASIEHFQIISIKDYRFTYKFKTACKHFAMRFCANARNKSEVVACLSEKVTNDTVHGYKSDVPKDCRQQLKAQLFQQRENIDFDPKLKNVCQADIKKFCTEIEHGNAQLLECLQSVNRADLSDPCEREVFKVKRQEMYDNSVDYALITMCAGTIEQFCPHHERETVLECLKLNKDQKGFSHKCRTVVTHRILEQNSNYQLNPSLQENCKVDINKYCTNALVRAASRPHKDVQGAVIKCLRDAFKKSNLMHRCEKEIANVLREQALDIGLNPLVKTLCKNELETVCRSNDDNEDDSGRLEECLKNALVQKKIATPECQVEVANMIEESQADIQVDPLLQQACALDLLKFCTDVPQGQGRHVKCLKIVIDKNPKQVSPDCKNMLSKRLEMYAHAAKLSAPPADFQELYQQVSISPAKHYFFLMILMMLGSIFVLGIFFGRAFRRQITSKRK